MGFIEIDHWLLVALTLVWDGVFVRRNEKQGGEALYCEWLGWRVAWGVHRRDRDALVIGVFEVLRYPCKFGLEGLRSVCVRFFGKIIKINDKKKNKKKNIK